MMKDKSQITALLIEDNPSDVLLVRKMLQHASFSGLTPISVNLVIANRLQEGLTSLGEQTCDVILLDLSLPDAFGLDSFLQLKHKFPTTPVIILSGNTAKETVMEAVQIGAQDYLTKNDLTADLLLKTIYYTIERHRLLLEIQQRAEMLEDQNIALNDFAHTLAHQIQGLLSQMVGYASLVDSHYQEQLSTPARQAVDQIMQSGYKMNNVITELLFLASMRSETVQMNVLDNRRILAEVVKRLRYQIRETKAVIKAPESWPVAVGYAPWIEEVWLNYMSNALKYGSKDGEPPVLQLGATRVNNGMVRFWIADSGPGIPELDQKRLFRPHTRVTSKKIRGEGLGLSIVWRIIQKSGGEVGVKSTEGEGSCFWFTLPESPKA
ncbi:MAG: hybrid sensor histidine kinase/response regulator [Anaerolineales bacterium]|nr:hybrid sensor histidine kinase/response regulator [Anaerolineales bacterium]